MRVIRCRRLERMSNRPAPTSADAIANNWVSGTPVNGSRPFVGGSGADAGGLSNVTPSTVGVIDGRVVPPPAGHALSVGVVVGNPVLAVSGTTKRLDSVGIGLGKGGGIMTLADRLPSALALPTSTTDAPHARPVLTANAAIAPSSGSLDLARVTQVTAHNSGRC